MSHVLSIALIVFLLAGKIAWAGPEINNYQWRLDHERGWHFYEEPEEEPQAETEPEPDPSTIVTETKVPEGPRPLSAEWLKVNLEKYQQKAIDDPTPENIEMYMYLQKAMMDKAQRFSEGVARLVQFAPYLDQNTRRPIATFASNASSRMALQGRKEALKRIAHQAGIFFFFKSECQHCEIQAPLLKNLQDLYGFKVFPVSLDGRPLQNNLFGGYERDLGQAKALGVMQTPAMFLGRPDSREILPLGQSSMARTELEERIIEAAIEAGWIDQKEYQSTKGWNSWMALDLKPDQVPQKMDDAQMLEFIKRAYEMQAGLGMSADSIAK